MCLLKLTTPRNLLLAVHCEKFSQYSIKLYRFIAKLTEIMMMQRDFIK